MFQPFLVLTLGPTFTTVHLGLQENSLTGPIPSELGNLGSLGKNPRVFGRQVMLIGVSLTIASDRLWLQGNALNGSLPVELTQTSKLGKPVNYLNSNYLSSVIVSDSRHFSWLVLIP